MGIGPDIPHELTRLPCWLTWSFDLRNGKLTKIPFTPDGMSYASSTDRETWGAFDTALESWKSDTALAGIGFAFDPDQGILGIDIDKCVDPITGPNDEAMQIVRSLNTYTEYSQSGTGLHLLCRAKMPEGRGRRKGAVECYSQGRYFTMTGRRLEGTPSNIRDCQAEVDELLARYFEPGGPTTVPEDRTPSVNNLRTLPDDDLLNRARNARGGDEFARLWAGDWKGRYPSQSEADAALLGKLRFWTGGDKARSFDLFNQSGLTRPKWGRDDYRESTWRAIDRGPVYDPASRSKPDPIDAEPEARADVPEEPARPTPPATPAKQAGASTETRENPPTPEAAAAREEREAHTLKSLRQVHRDMGAALERGDFADLHDVARGLASILRTRSAPAVTRGKSWTEIAFSTVNEGETLLGNRYLCKAGAMLLIGPSGVGKSSASCQQDMQWALGREAFGIRPSRPLRIMTIQAENDDGDQIEMAQGVMKGLKLTSEDMDQIDANTHTRTSFNVSDKFLEELEAEVEAWKPDIVRVDPLNSYLGTDPKDVKAVNEFCRQGVSPLLFNHGCAAIFVHHTPKTNFRESTGKWSTVDWAYAGGGAADLTNWARAVLVVDPVNIDEGIYRFIAAKRGRRIGWKNEAGESVTERFFRYAREPGLIYWEEADAPEEATKPHKKTKTDLLDLIPETGSIEKAALISKAQDAGIGIKKAEGWINQLVADGVAQTVNVPRPGTRPAVHLSRRTAGDS
ncbi:MAG TPA: AAA family ATPase [Kiritimatiellia bacterium]|nr:AAA family ATPase [Kiritimatiellia bacterium]